MSSPHIDAQGHVTEAFADCMVKLAAAWPSARPLTPTMIQVYARGLYDLSIEQVRACFGRAVLEAKFLPSVAEVRTYLAPSADDAAVIAWTGLEKAAREAGAYSSLEVEDGYAAAALTATVGSWPRFCELDAGPELALARQAFLVSYRHARRLAPKARIRLPGRCEADGKYADEALAGRVWAATLTAGWTVELHRDRPRTALPESASVNRLTTGEAHGSDS